MRLAVALRAASTPARVYRLCLWADQHATPADLAGLAEIRAELPAAALDWLDRRRELLRRPAGAPAPFMRRALAAHVTLYAARGRRPRTRRLLLVFCDRAQQPGTPTPILLRHLPAEGCDALLLRDAAGIRFLRGIPGYAEDAAGLAARLTRDVAALDPAGLACLGVSAGGEPALALGQLLGAGIAVSVNGSDPALGRRRGDPAGATDGQEFARLLAARGGDAGGTRLLRLFSAERRPEREADAGLALRHPASLGLPVQGVRTHALLHALAERGELGGFLRDLLEGSLGPGPWC